MSNGKRWIDIPNGFSAGDFVYLLQLKSNSRRYSKILPSDLSKFRRQPQDEILPVLDLTPVENKELSYFPEGIYVTEVEVDSPAYKAGLQAGDIIYEYNGGAVGSVQDFSDMILMSEKGDSVTIKLKRTGRGGEYRELEYTVKMGLRLD